LKLRLHYTI